MPLENRVDPYGVIFRSPARGTMFGNRGGAIHNSAREIVRPFKSDRWITCLLKFKGRHRDVMAPGRYTELFFLDEAVAFAAGHRPCAECRRGRYIAFLSAWVRCHPGTSIGTIRAPHVDAELQRARIDKRRDKVTYQAPLSSLPNGCFVEIDGHAHLVWDDALLLWTPERSSTRRQRPDDLTVTVLTPRPIVQCFELGYRPTVHDTAQASANSCCLRW